MATRRNPAERADALAEENSELRSKLDRITGIAMSSDAIDSEKGLRCSLERISDVLGIEEDDEDEDDEGGDDESGDDEGGDDESGDDESDDDESDDDE